ncbi:MAG: DUF3795 domain-containing protein [Elusimicrobia bacterium]|nr:DUF3795 domain-containing protein [Elusimicrobiota bacterium]
MENRAYCGLNCAECDAFKATKNNDDKLRAVTAKNWSAAYNADIKPENINCTGCKSGGIKFSYCSMCKIRACNIGKSIADCSCCAEYPCADETPVITHSRDAKDFLEAKRKTDR